MEEQFKREDRILKDLMAEAGTERPSLSFDDNVMRSIEKAGSKIPAYKPLITGRVWILISLSFLAILAAIYMSGPGDSQLLDRLFGNAEFSLPEYNIPISFIYAVAFLGLFLLQIPILKKQFIDRR